MTEEDNMIFPNGVGFRFIVKPSLSEDHAKGVRYFIINNYSRLFKNILVSFHDGCEVNEGLVSSDDKLKGKQMVVKILCIKPTITIGKDNEDVFYKKLEFMFSKHFIDLIQSIPETNYKAELGAFLFEKSLLGA